MTSPESRPKWKNVSLDADLVALLNKVCDELEPTLGFRPTLSQAVRRLIKTTLSPKEGAK